MSLRNLPRAEGVPRIPGLEWDAPSSALERWSPRAAAADSGADVSIFDPIGATWDGSGFTVKKLAAILRSIGDKPITVSIDSPGGDMFEGIAIYNTLVDHPAEVTIKVLGLAASAASLIAMAGDKIVIGGASFLMIHNCWGVVVGNRHDFTQAAELFAPFDASMAAIYAARSGQSAKAVAQLMDEETWLAATDAVAKGFADEAAALKGPPPADKQTSARARLDASLARAGMPRSERRALLRDYAGAPRAAGTAMPGAGFLDEAQQLLATLKS